MRVIRFATLCCFVLALAAGIFAIAAWQPALAPIPPPAATGFSPGLVKRGAELAAIGNCDVCHTASSGREFAGGRAIATPFGAIYSTNITPDTATGIGAWSEAAFGRALRRGVARDGSYLYPAFPYDHFTLVSDDDDKALYAFLMTRAPVRAGTPANTLPFPLNLRLMVYGWNLLFLREGPYRADPAHDETWNRGAYLAEGIGHCGACHTPRNLLGAERRTQEFAGGTVDGWTAYALNGNSPAPVPWDTEALASYLSRGFAVTHGVPRGPMAEVANDLRSVPQDDARAIATYVGAQMRNAAMVGDQVAIRAAAQIERGKTTAAASADSQTDTLRIADEGDGAVIYAGACAGCHQGPRAMPYGGIDLALSSGINGPTPDNLVNVVLYGLPAAEAARAPIMPGFANAIDDRQLAALAGYLRAHFTAKGPWTDIEQSVRAARSSARAATVSHAPSNTPAPPGTSQRTTNEAQR